MEKTFELHAHDPKKFCAARAHSFDDNEIGVVCFISCDEGVTNHHFCVWLIMEKT